MGTSSSRGTSRPEPTVDEQAELAELEAIAAIPEDQREALAALTDDQRAELAAAPAADPVADVQPDPEVDVVDAEPVDEAPRVSIPGQPGHPPRPNEGHPGVATN